MNDTHTPKSHIYTHEHTYARKHAHQCDIVHCVFRGALSGVWMSHIYVPKLEGSLSAYETFLSDGSVTQLRKPPAPDKSIRRELSSFAELP